MSNMLKCPNPSCPYVFDPSQVPVSVVLSCPRCGMQFTLGAPARSPTSAPTHSAPPRPPAPPQQPGTPEAASRAAVEERAPQERSREHRLPRRGTSRTQVYVLAGVAALLMATTAVVIVIMALRRDAPTADTMTRIKDFNVGVDPPPQGWAKDENLRVKIGSPWVLAYKREKPEAYAAFGAAEPGKGRAPRPSELRTDLMQAFPKLFDLSTLRRDPPGEPKWLGEEIAPAHGMTFLIRTTDGLEWRGEAYSVAHKGIGYYWLSWCGEGDYEALKSEFAAFRGKFKLLGLRDDWKERQPNVNDFKGDKVRYTITDAEDVWKPVRPADLPQLKELEPELDNRLGAAITPRHDRKAQPDEAELSVYIVDARGDPTEAARKYAEDLERARITAADAKLPPPTFTELTAADPLLGDPIVTQVPNSTPVVRLLSQVTNAESAARFTVVSGLTVGEKHVIVHCWCKAGKRDVFETKFVQIASSLR